MFPFVPHALIFALGHKPRLERYANNYYVVNCQNITVFLKTHAGWDDKLDQLVNFVKYYNREQCL